MEVYTLTELSEKLNLTESKLRYHAKRYRDYLHTVGEGKATRYKEESIPVLRFILSCVKRNMLRPDIETALSEQFPRVIDIDSDVTIKTVELTQEANSKELVLFQGVVNDLAELKRQVQEDRHAIQYLGEQLKEQQMIIERLNKPWYKRLFGG